MGVNLDRKVLIIDSGDLNSISSEIISQNGGFLTMEDEIGSLKDNIAKIQENILRCKKEAEKPKNNTNTKYNFCFSKVNAILSGRRHPLGTNRGFDYYKRSN